MDIAILIRTSLIGRPGVSRWDAEEHPGVPASAGHMPTGVAPASGRPGGSRWHAKEHPGVPASAGGIPAGGAAYCPASPIRLKPGLRSDGGRASRRQPVACRRTSGSPGVSRWNICRGRSLLPGKPGPAKAGTPVGRRSGVPAVVGGMPKNIRESRRQPVGYLPGAQPTARQAWSG
jgi:hypothetical protein